LTWHTGPVISGQESAPPSPRRAGRRRPFGKPCVSHRRGPSSRKPKRLGASLDLRNAQTSAGKNVSRRTSRLLPTAAFRTHALYSRLPSDPGFWLPPGPGRRRVRGGRGADRWAMFRLKPGAGFLSISPAMRSSMAFEGGPTGGRSPSPETGPASMRRERVAGDDGHRAVAA